jgi:hypothetical protein
LHAKENVCRFLPMFVFLCYNSQDKIFAPTSVLVGPQNIYENNKKTVFLFLKILNYLDIIIVVNTMFIPRHHVSFQVFSPKVGL